MSLVNTGADPGIFLTEAQVINYLAGSSCPKGNLHLLTA